MNSLSFILNADWQTQKSGAATFMRALLHGFDYVGIDYVVVKMREEEQQPADVNKKEILSQTGFIPLRPVKRKPKLLRVFLGYLKTLLQDCWHLWKNRKDLRGRVIVVNEFGCETIPIAARLVFPFSKVVALAHTHPGTGDYARHPVRRMIEKMCYWSVSDIIYNSESLKNEWENIGVGASGHSPVRREKIIHYGIADPDETLPDDYPKKPAGCIDILCASRFVKWKGHRGLIEAFEKYVGASGRSPVRLILVGDGTELQGCIEYAKEIGLDIGNDIIFMGAKPEAAKYFNGADIGIQLSIEPEAFGLVFLEAMSRGKPVIGTNIGGIPEVVGECGLLVEPFDIDAAADAIGRLVKDASLRLELGEKGLQRWKEQFRVERMVNDYIAYFEG